MLDGLALQEPEPLYNAKELINGKNLAKGRDTVSRYSPPKPLFRPLSVERQPLPPPRLFRRNLNRRTQPSSQQRSESGQNPTRTQPRPEITISEQFEREESPHLELSAEQLEQLEQEVYFMIMAEFT